LSPKFRPKLREKAEAVQRKLVRLRKKRPESKHLAALTKKSHAAWQSYHSLGHRLRKLQVPMRQQVVAYLVRFYEGRAVPFDRRLTLRLIGEKTRLESQGAADFYLCEPREAQRQKLAEYRDEMGAFTAFLKTVYASQQAESAAH
jgi:hypothetical protein